jgi:hypothetical protein
MTAPERLFRDFGDGSAAVINWTNKKFANSNTSIIQHSGEGNVVLMRDHWLKALAQDFGIEGSIRDDFVEAVLTLAEDFQRKSQIKRLPERPLRDFVPRQDNIIDYIRSPEGFGPWLDAGLLTRPLLNKLSPKAYTALANWLQRHELPEGLHIPTKSELVSERIANADRQLLSEGARLSAVQAMRRTRQRQREKRL